MNFKQALENYLLTYAGLSALIGSNLFPDEFPQGFAGKGIAYTTISAPRETAVKDPGIVYETLQFTALGATGKECDDILIQLAAALRDYKGIMGTVGADTGVQVDCTKERNGRYNIPSDPRLTGVVLRGDDWEIDYHE